MHIGVPKEIKVHEYRVGLTPASVAELVAHGHEVFVEKKAGTGIDCSDSARGGKAANDSMRTRRIGPVVNHAGGAPWCQACARVVQ